jgi:hypothetical protein
MGGNKPVKNVLLFSPSRADLDTAAFGRCFAFRLRRWRCSGGSANVQPPSLWRWPRDLRARLLPSRIVSGASCPLARAPPLPPAGNLLTGPAAGRRDILRLPTDVNKHLTARERSAISHLQAHMLVAKLRWCVSRSFQAAATEWRGQSWPSGCRHRPACLFLAILRTNSRCA